MFPARTPGAFPLLRGALQRRRPDAKPPAVPAAPAMGATPAWGPRLLRCFRTLSLSILAPSSSVETRAAKAAGQLAASEEAQMPPCSHSALSASSVTYKVAEPHSGAVEALLLQLDDPPAPTTRRLGAVHPSDASRHPPGARARLSTESIHTCPRWLALWQEDRETHTRT